MTSRVLGCVATISSVVGLIAVVGAVVVTYLLGG